MSVKLFVRVEWNETFRTRRDLFAPKKFSNLCPEILVEWIAPHNGSTFHRLKVVVSHSTQHTKTNRTSQLTAWPLFLIKFRYRISTHTGGFNKSIIAFFVRICSSPQNCSCKLQVINKYKIYFTIDTTREHERRRIA